MRGNKGVDWGVKWRYTLNAVNSNECMHGSRALLYAHLGRRNASNSLRDVPSCSLWVPHFPVWYRYSICIGLHWNVWGTVLLHTALLKYTANNVTYVKPCALSILCTFVLQWNWSRLCSFTHQWCTFDNQLLTYQYLKNTLEKIICVVEVCLNCSMLGCKTPLQFTWSTLYVKVVTFMHYAYS